MMERERLEGHGWGEEGGGVGLRASRVNSHICEIVMRRYRKQ